MEFTEHTVTSADGTTIGYRKTGAGPALVICHGGGRISQNYAKLALALSDSFTVYIPDRRGRGLSGPEGDSYNLCKASEDLIAVLQDADAEFIFGHSAGALIALETMLTKPLPRIALYEPPLSFNGSVPTGWLPAFEKALQRKKHARAVAISLQGLKVNESMNKMPLAVLSTLLGSIALLEGNREKGTRMFDLLHTLPADVHMLREADDTFHRFRSMPANTLLINGSGSPSYFREGLDKLHGILPNSERLELEGFDHYSPEQKTGELREVLKRFFSL